jgi:catechol 2,3-dioxygenase-like lactoylglutathione lyase family enzyme
MFHSTAMVRDYDLAVERLRDLVGLRVLEYGESTQPEIGRRGGMAWVGDNSVEIGQPIVPGGGAARFVARTGGGMHSVAVQVSDLEATIAHVEAAGARMAARPMPEVFFTDPRDTGGVFFEWSSLELDVDPRFGGPVPDLGRPALLDVTHHAFVGALVDDPLRRAEFYARLLGTEVTFEDARAAIGSPRAGVSLRDCTLALFDLPGPDSGVTWGVEHYGRGST